MNAQEPETTSGEWSIGQILLDDFVVERALNCRTRLNNNVRSKKSNTVS